MTRLAVQDVMSTEVISVEETATFKEVVTLLENHGAGALVVFRDGVPVGVVSEADLLLKQGFPAAGWRGGLRGRRRLRNKARGWKAADLMSAPPVTVDSHASLAAAARLMVRNKVKQMPVSDPDGRLVGMVNRADLITAFLRSDSDIRAEVLERAFGPVLAPPGSVTVRVHDGVVQLKGRVERRSWVDVLEETTCHIDGVVRVVNELSYQYDDTIRHSTRIPDAVPGLYGAGTGRPI